MRLRLYRAAAMGEAMAQLRAELGAEAVILDTRRVAGGVEVTAAVEGRTEPAPRLADDEPLLILPSGPSARVPALAPRLAWHGPPAALAERLAGAAESLAGRLAAALPFAALPEAVSRPLLLVGPPGAGKTLSCAKLATRAVLAGRPPLVVTADDARAGAPEQLAAFTRLLNLPLAIAPQAAVLAKALAHRRDGQPVLVDSAGCDPRRPEEAAALAALARAIDAVLVVALPAGLDAADAAEMAAAFVGLGAAHLLPTRLDSRCRLGGILAAAEAGLALTEAGIGRSPADGLVPIDAAWLARRLLAGAEAEPLA